MADHRGHPLVFQLSARTRLSGRPSERSEPAKLVVHQRLNAFNEFCFKEWPVIRFSSDGRLAFLFFESYTQLHAVDLLRNTRLVFKAVPAFAIDVSDFAVINPTTILVLEPETLWLFRLDVESEKLETIELHRARPKSWPTYVFTEIRGTGVELRRTVLNQNYATELRFVRLDVDDAHFEVDAVERVEGARDYRLSSDGRWLRGLPFLSRELDTLDVFDLERRKWSTKKLSGEVGRLEDCSFSWTNDRVFLSGYDEVNDERRFSVFCLNLKESEWTKLPIVAANVRRISAIVDAESGEASGLLLMNGDESSGNWRMEVYRLLFRTPDSLLRLAVDALRRHNLDVRGKEGFHKVMNGPCKSVFPSLYAGMTPILRL